MTHFKSYAAVEDRAERMMNDLDHTFQTTNMLAGEYDEAVKDIEDWVAEQTLLLRNRKFLEDVTQ